MPADAPLIFIIAGEPSGDVLGGALMTALRERLGGEVRFAGVGGERMEEQGLRSLVPIEELAIIGLAEVLPKARLIFRRVREVEAAITRLAPDAVVTIDSSGFTWRIAKRLREAGSRLPLIHYVAPMVWAWRPGKARKVARWYDHLMALLPFEPPYFEKVGLPCSYVGHPVVEGPAGRGDAARFRTRHAIAPDRRILCLLPGSRKGEVSRHLPIFEATLRLLGSDAESLDLVIPTLGYLRPTIAALTAGWPWKVTIIQDQGEKFDAFAASTAALAASGTVALELAMAELPALIAYRTTALTGWLLRRAVKVPYVNLVNVILDRPAIPELVLEDCQPAKLAPVLRRLLLDEHSRADQISACREALARLGRGVFSPSRRAADQVLAVMAEIKAKSGEAK